MRTRAAIGMVFLLCLPLAGVVTAAADAPPAGAASDGGGPATGPGTTGSPAPDTAAAQPGVPQSTDPQPNAWQPTGPQPTAPQPTDAPTGDAGAAASDPAAVRALPQDLDAHIVASPDGLALSVTALRDLPPVSLDVEGATGAPATTPNLPAGVEVKVPLGRPTGDVRVTAFGPAIVPATATRLENGADPALPKAMVTQVLGAVATTKGARLASGSPSVASSGSGPAASPSVAKAATASPSNVQPPAASPSPTGGPVFGAALPETIAGHVAYVATDGVSLIPHAGVLVGIFDANWCVEDELIGVTLTNATGAFQAQIPFDETDPCQGGSADVEVFALYAGNVATVTNAGGSPYGIVSSTHPDAADGLDIGTIYPGSRMTQGAARFHAWSIQAHQFVATETLRDIPEIVTRFPSPDDPWPHYHAAVGNGIFAREIHIGGDGDWDLAPGAFMHEIGHFVQDDAYHFPQLVINPGGSHSLCSVTEPRGLAWGEGWATFFSLASVGSSRLEYPGGIFLDFETRDFCPPLVGDLSETNVAATLWDLYDHDADGLDTVSFPFGEIHKRLVLGGPDFSFAEYRESWSAWLPRRDFVRAALQNGIDYDVVRPMASFPVPHSLSGWTRGNATVVVHTSDPDSNVVAVQLRISSDAMCTDADTLVPDSALDGRAYVIDTTLLPDHALGMRFCARGQSLDGGWGAYAASTNLGIDNTAPHASAPLLVTGTLGSNGWFRTTPTFRGAGSDATSGVASTCAATSSGGPWACTAMGLQITSDGEGQVLSMVTDRAGNADIGIPLAVKVDRAKPNCALAVDAAPGTSPWYRSDALVSLVTTDATSGVATVTYSLDGAAVIPYAGPFAVAGSRIHRITCIATDVAGNQLRADLTLALDTDIPTVTAPVFPAGTGWLRGRVVAVPTVSDRTSMVGGVSCTLDGAPLACTNNVATAAIPSGDHTLAVTGTDKAGNNATTTRQVRVDATLPTCGIAFSGTPGLSGWFVTGGDASLTADDAHSGVATVARAVDSQPNAPYTAPIALASGRHMVRCTVTDVAGNNAVVTQAIAVDTAAPVVTLAISPALPNAGASWRGMVTLFPRASDVLSGVQSMTCTRDALPVACLNGGSVTVTGVGPHSVAVTSIDKAGNTATVQRDFTIVA